MWEGNGGGGGESGYEGCSEFKGPEQCWRDNLNGLGCCELWESTHQAKDRVLEERFSTGWVCCISKKPQILRVL